MTILSFHKALVKRKYSKLYSSKAKKKPGRNPRDQTLIDIVIEIKTVPQTPVSHPYVERVVGICRQEYLDHLLFWNTIDLQRKLDQFQKYYNETRAHSSLAWKTPAGMAPEEHAEQKIVALDHYRWRPHCRDLYILLEAA